MMKNPGKNFLIIPGVVFISLFICLLPTPAQQSKSVPKSSTYVDKHGVLRWASDKSEVALFGVNYTTPFAHPYRMHKRLNIPHEKAIDQDVYHFARLGFDAFRVHVWDCEISDTLGNLIENEHLRLFDYLLAKLKERKIKILITPIAYWGNGYPEPEEKTPGFSTKYGKGNCLTNPEAIKAQERYLGQFVNHVNQYTGIAYKNDPDIIAFEISNEPHHGGTVEETRIFINRLAKAIRNTGCAKPVFYNFSHSIHLAEAYFDADVDGGTFQWYPAGLVKGNEIHGNFLTNVADYDIPFSENKKFQKMAKVVYEFDAADIGRSYIYPYMAKSFREAGFQFATQFAYDPLHMAPFNTDYQTHYMNLAYAPQKALSLKIAGEVFRKMPLGKESGNYPADTVFDVFRVSYKSDLAEMVNDEKFFYTNNTTTRPPFPEKLNAIAGFGNSPVVQYEGLGAYFLDQIEYGVWRLEVMPDAVWVDDPFAKASPRKEVSVISWNTRKMTVNLPDLEQDFKITGLNDGNIVSQSAQGNTFEVGPGSYLLVYKGKNTAWKATDKWKNITLKEFVAPVSKLKKTYVLHQPLEEISAGKPYGVEAKVMSPDVPDKVEIFLYGRRWRPEIIEMKKTTAYTYTATIDTAHIREGMLRYYIAVKSKGAGMTFPSGSEGLPSEWDFYDQNPYMVRVVDSVTPICLFDAVKDGGYVYGNSWFPVVPSKEAGESVLNINIRNLNREGHNYSGRFFFADKVKGRRADFDRFNILVINGYSTTGKPVQVQVAFIDNMGYAYGGFLEIDSEPGNYPINISDLERIPAINLPNAYPTFLPAYFFNDTEKEFNLMNMESIQFSVGPGIPESEYNRAFGVAIGKIFLK
ncbi:MAG: cellulase family glycosylhydrolase [Bacteroidales bacterium]|nr:cellulase family glycosylhydrolase [Bacteroidales bacterium]